MIVKLKTWTWGNLNVRHLVESGDAEEIIDVVKVWSELSDSEKEREAVDKKVASLLRNKIISYGKRS